MAILVKETIQKERGFIVKSEVQVQRFRRGRGSGIKVLGAWAVG
jgi:hypothetical protein